MVLEWICDLGGNQQENAFHYCFNRLLTCALTIGGATLRLLFMKYLRIRKYPKQIVSKRMAV